MGGVFSFAIFGQAGGGMRSILYGSVTYEDSYSQIDMDVRNRNRGPRAGVRGRTRAYGVATRAVRTTHVSCLVKLEPPGGPLEDFLSEKET